MAAIFSTNNYNYDVKMEKFKDTVFEFANSDPNHPLSPSQSTFIQQQLTLTFPVFHTPTHPTYSAMIQEAIKGLNEEGGSSEELISKYIKDKFECLPWAHNMYLSHHLRKLCESGEIVCDLTRKCYTMPVGARTPESNSCKKARKRRLVRKRKKGRNGDDEGDLGGENEVEESGDVFGFQEEDMEEVGRNEEEEGNLSGRKEVEVSWFQEEEVQEFGKSRIKGIRRSLVFTESEEAGRTIVDEGEQNVERSNELAQEDGRCGTNNVPEDNDDVGRTAADEEQQHLVVERHDEVLAPEDMDKKMLVPAECVEESPVTIISPPVTNIRYDNDPELAVKESGSKETELMLVLYKGNTSICEVSAKITRISDTKDRMIVCGLSSSPEFSQPARKSFSRKRLKACSQKKSKVSLEPLPSSSDLVVVPHQLKLDPEKPAFKTSSKKRFNSGRRKKKDRLKRMPSLPAADVDCSLREHDHLQELLPQRVIETKVSEVEREMEAVWLEPMLKGKYFIQCSVHRGSSNSKCNRFCLDCMGDAICPKCVSHHKDHPVVQIRYYSRLNVVKADEMQPHLDISDIQTFIQFSARIVFLDRCPQPKAAKIVTRCECCRRGIIESFRFCSLRCKMFDIRRQSTKFFPINQSQQASTLSLLKGPSIEQLETQSDFNPSHLNIREDPMSLEDEEDLPLKNFVGKRGKRKKQLVQKFTANAHLATEASYSSGSKASVDLPNLECSKHQIEEQEREGQIDVGLDVEASLSTYVEGDVPTSPQKCEQEPKQSEETMDLVNSQSKKLKNSGQGRKSKDMEVIDDDAEGLNKPTTEQYSQKLTKQLKKDSQGTMRIELEATKEDLSGSSNLSVHQQGLREPATNQHYQIKPENKGTQKRTHELLEAPKNDATGSLDLHLEQQAGSSELETVLQVRKQKKERCGRPRKLKKGSRKEQEFEETNKKPRKVGRGRPRKQQDVCKEDSAAPLESDHKLEDTEHIMNFCPDKSPSEAHETLERGQARPSSDDDIHQRKRQNLDGRDQLDKQHEELTYHELVVNNGKFEVESQVSGPIEKSGKNNAIQVPLSSKDQLRSRMKQQF